MSHADNATDRRAVIIDAAVRVLAREGIADTTTRKIAAEASVNQAMISYYFGCKDGLLYAVLQEMMRRTEEIAHASLPRGRDLAASLGGAIEAFWSHVEQAPQLQIMQYELTLYALRRPDSAWLAKRQYEGYCAIVAALIDAVSSDAGERLGESPEALARFIVGGLDGLILQHISDPDSERARRDLRRLVTATLALAQSSSSRSASDRLAAEPS